MRRALLLLLLTACPAPAATDDGLTVRDAGADPCLATDQDGDGFSTLASCGEVDCDDTNIGVFPGAPEACNGIDEDCDGEADEDLGEGTCGVGPGQRVVPFCGDGAPAACTPAPPSEEVCNGLDDDCDGDTDEDLIGETCGVGACVARAECNGGTWSACQPAPPSAEICNRIDDDCNGEVDEGLGTEVVESTYSTLVGQHAQCDGSGQRIGPDCNAAFNRFCAAHGCSTTGFGPLENFNDVAVAGCVRATGFDVPYATLATFHPPCDGSGQRIGPDCNAAMHRYCANQPGFVSGFGPAEQSATTALVQCVAADVGTVVQTTYSTLVQHHGGCTQQSRIGPDCNAAINRFCRSQGHATGWGPVENSGDVAVVTCVR